MPQPNMQQMLKQVQKMQQDMMAAQESLKDEVVEASAGGGMVTVEVTGDLRIKSVKINPQAVDPDDVELLRHGFVLGPLDHVIDTSTLTSSKKAPGRALQAMPGQEPVEASSLMSGFFSQEAFG